MARPRKPTAALELAGAFDRNPNRKREDEPRPETPIGEPPEHLGEVGAAIWHEMVREGFWLTSADAFMLEIAVKYMTVFRSGVSDPKLVTPLINVLNKLGFGPAERSKIKAPGAKQKSEENPFAEFT